MIRLNILYSFHILFSNLYNFPEKKKYTDSPIDIYITIKEMKILKKVLYSLEMCNT